MLIALLFLAARPAARPAPAPAAWKTIDVVSATCGAAAPARVTFQIPPGYVVRTSAKGLTAGCLWGTSQDLALVLGESEATFDRVEKGVFQARLTTTIEFDPATGKFTDENDLAGLFNRVGVSGASVSRRTLAGAPAVVVTGRSPNGAPLYLLYLALVRESGAEVLLVNFHAPVDPGAGRPDVEMWRRFVGSIRTGK
jgi:hypothetical protein